MIHTTDEHILKRLEKMNSISDSFCGAKWFEGTLWLYHGVTSSCHHNPFHNIIPDVENPSSIFNTAHKIDARIGMLNGERRSECNTCWKIEQAGGVSDRVYKTEFIDTLDEWANNKELIPLTVTPLNLELAFSRACNLSCSYCMPYFSSEWEADIKKNGSYNLKTDSRMNRGMFKAASMDARAKQVTDLFWKWWPEVEKTLKTVKLTGGEPLMSADCWKLLEKISDSEIFNGNVIVNTNLIHDVSIIEKLISLMKTKKLGISASLESSLKDAEYIRHGFNSEIWSRNLDLVLRSNVKVTLSTSINVLSIWSLNEYIEYVIELKKKYGNNMVSMNCNFVNKPMYLQLQLIPKMLRNELADSLYFYLDNTTLFFHEKEHIRRCIKYLQNNDFSDNTFTLDDAITDLKKFIFEYDRRKNKNFRVLDSRFVKWISL